MYEGAFYIPSHNLVIGNYTHNDRLFVDVHGLAPSAADGSPSVPHMVIRKADADAVHDSNMKYYQAQVDTEAHVRHLPAT